MQEFEGARDNATIQYENVTWEPRRRVEQAMRKLKGLNPAYILIQDLKQNQNVLK
jgi:hypothetical protein